MKATTTSATLVLLSLIVIYQSLASPAQHSKKPYWEDLSPAEKTKVLNSPTTNKDAVEYLKKKWKATDDKRTFDLLNDLTSYQGGGDTEKFYFYIFNEILLASDGALAEAMGDYSIKMVQRNPPFTIVYFTRDEEVQEKYANAIGYELSYYDNESNTGAGFREFKRKLEEALPKDIRKLHHKTLLEFYGTIEKAMADATN